MNREQLEQLKQLEANLWAAADNLRANSDLKASEYSTPVLGLIFLKFADINYRRHEEAILNEYQQLKGTRREKSLHEIAVAKCGFYLPEHARYRYLLNLPENQDIAKAIEKAMEAIEEYKPELAGSLPKDEYYRLTRTTETRLLPFDLLRQFDNIPDSATGDLIEVNKRRIALLEKMAEELYREWFVRMRFPGHQHTRFVKGVPEGWSETQLGKIARFTMGQSPKSEFYNEIGEGLPFHQGVGTYGDRFPNTSTYCSVDGRRAFMGDILFSVRAPVGRLNIADCDMIIGRGLAAIKHVDSKNSYLYYLLKTVFANEDIIGNGSIFNSVGKDELARFGVHGHPVSLVQKFDDIARPIDQQIERLIRSKAILTKTRDLLLPRLISGKLSVENLDIQFPPSMQVDASAAAIESEAGG